MRLEGVYDGYERHSETAEREDGKASSLHDVATTRAQRQRLQRKAAPQ